MDLPEMIEALRRERACLDEAIGSIERLLREREPRQRRPPLHLKLAEAGVDVAFAEIGVALGIRLDTYSITYPVAHFPFSDDNKCNSHSKH